MVTRPAADAAKGRARPGPVASAARTALAEIETDHAAAPLLIAMGQRMAQDVDECERPADRIAAVRMVLRLVEILDGALLGPASTPQPEDDPDPDGGDPDDPFNIGAVPPGVGDET